MIVHYFINSEYFQHALYIKLDISFMLITKNDYTAFESNKLNKFVFYAVIKAQSPVSKKFMLID